MVPTKRTGKRGRPSIGYVCRTRAARGAAACGVGYAVPVKDLHDAVVRGLEQVLSPERLDQVLQDLATEWTAQADAHGVQRAGFEAGLAKVDVELRHLTGALADGAAVDRGAHARPEMR